MRIAWLAPKDMKPTDNIPANRYKYFELFRLFAEARRFYRRGDFTKAIKKFEPDLLCVLGYKRQDYKTALKLKIPYILIEHDVATLLGLNQYADIERESITRAAGIITVGEGHVDYIKQKYGKEAFAVYLRPLKGDLDFAPLPKLPGKNLVYMGEVQPWHKRGQQKGFRSYREIFKAFTKHGWGVHIYPRVKRSSSLIREYKAVGCTFHKTVKQTNLYREMSQYTAGLQSYNPFGISDAGRKCIAYCRPNKIWDYLAAGIPTIGYNGGGGMKLYDGKWGVVLNSLDEIPNIKLPEGIEQHRQTEVIDNDAERVKDYFSTCL